jgi:N utilization substance protein B
MGHRRRARELALQMLFQLDLTGDAVEEMAEQFWRDTPAGDEERTFAQHLVLGVAGTREALDQRIAGVARNWRLERMAVVDRNVLRLALFELFDDVATPPAVVIDEAVEIAKKFGGSDSGAFINGVLDAIRRQHEAGR